MKKITAFTLLEIMIVISIFGLLAAITFGVAKGAYAKARDTKRKTDLQSMKVAMVQYKALNSQFPTEGFLEGYDGIGFAQCSGWGDTGWYALTRALRPYLATLPLDPKGCANGSDYSRKYFIVVNAMCTSAVWRNCIAGKEQFHGSSYAIWTTLENPLDPDRNGPLNIDSKYAPLLYYWNSYTNTPNVDSSKYGVGCSLRDYRSFTNKDSQLITPCDP